jgi:hypothetical protein
MPRLREVKQDAMDEDRKPLGDLPASEFYGEGCDRDSYVVVDKGIERPSGLRMEVEVGCETLEATRAVPEEKQEPLEKTEEGVVVYADENAGAVAQEVAQGEDAASASASASASQPEPMADEAP